MQLNVNDAQAIEVSELTFGGEFNETLVHQAVVAYMAGGRQGTKQQKTRSDVASDLAWRWCHLRSSPSRSLAEAQQEDVSRSSALHPLRAGA